MRLVLRARALKCGFCVPDALVDGSVDLINSEKDITVLARSGRHVLEWFRGVGTMSQEHRRAASASLMHPAMLRST
jgi:hypothetical protein